MRRLRIVNRRQSGWLDLALAAALLVSLGGGQELCAQQEQSDAQKLAERVEQLEQQLQQTQDALASVKTGSWVQVFYAMIICDLIAAFMALLWLKPVAARTLAHYNQIYEQERAAEAARVKAAQTGA